MASTTRYFMPLIEDASPEEQQRRNDLRMAADPSVTQTSEAWAAFHLVSGGGPILTVAQCGDALGMTGAVVTQAQLAEYTAHCSKGQVNFADFRQILQGHVQPTVEDAIKGFSKFFAGYPLPRAVKDKDSEPTLVDETATMTADRIRATFMNTADKVPGDIIDKFYEHADLKAGGKFDFAAVAGQYLQKAN